MTMKACGVDYRVHYHQSTPLLGHSDHFFGGAHTYARVPRCHARGGARALRSNRRAAVLSTSTAPWRRIVRHAADGARARGHALAADRDRQALSRRRCVSGRRRGHRRADRLDRDDRLRRQPRRRAAASRLDSRRGRSELAAWTERVRRSPRAPSLPSTSGCACVARTRTRSRRSTGAAPPTRPPLPPRSRRSRGARSGGLAVHWGRKVLEVRPPVALDKGLGIARFLHGQPVAAALYVGDDTPTWMPFAGCARSSQKEPWTTAICAAGQLRRSSPGAGGGGRPPARRHRRCARLLQALL